MKIVKATLMNRRMNGVSDYLCRVYLDCNITCRSAIYYMTNTTFHDPWVVDSIMFVKQTNEN